MKKTLALSFVFALTLSAIPALAQQNMADMKSMNMNKPATDAKATYDAKGMVKKVDINSGMVTLAHGPVKNLNWPPMTMGFKVKDKMLLDKLSIGQTVEFEFVQADGGYVITAVK